MRKIDLAKYGITGTTEVVYNPSYEELFAEETKPTLEGYEKGQVSELGAELTSIDSFRLPINNSYKQETRNNQDMLYDCDWGSNASSLYTFIYG